MWYTYLIIALLLLAAELIYFRIADKCNIIDKPNERSSHKTIVLRGGGIIYILGMWLYAAFFGLEYWPFLLGLTLVAGISFVDDIHSQPDSVRCFFCRARWRVGSFPEGQVPISRDSAGRMI